MCVLAAGLLTALAGPSLIGRICTADDLGSFHLPLRAFYADCLKHGDRFDWMPQLYCGWFVTGEGQLGGYHPLHWLLYRCLPLSTAFGLECLLGYPLMIWGMYRLLRRWEIPRDSAMFGGVSFAFSGFCLLHFVHVNAIEIVAHLPWLLLAIDVSIKSEDRRTSRRAGIAIAALTGSQLLLGYPQYVWLSLVAEFGYFIWLSWQRANFRASLARLTFWKTIGVALGAVQLLPTIEALGESARQAADSSFSGWGSLAPLNLIQLFDPYLFATRVVGQNTHELGLYAGSVVLLLAIWAVTNGGGSLIRLRLVNGAIGLIAIGFLLAMGEFGPFRWLVSHLPVINKFRFPCRAIVLVHLGLAPLAALGLTKLGNSDDRSRRALKCIWAAAGISIALAIAGPIVWPEYVSSLPLVWIGPVLFTFAASLMTLAHTRFRFARGALMLLAAVDLGIYGMSYAVYPSSMPLEPFVATVDAPPGPSTGRVAGDLVAPNQRGLRIGNEMLLAGWSRVDGYAGLEPARRLDYPRTAALQVAGVGWISSVDQFADSDSTGLSDRGWRELSEPLPRARFVNQVTVSVDPARDISRIAIEKYALVDTPLDLAPPENDRGAVQIVYDRPGDIRMQVSTPTRQLLVLAESWHCGWQAMANDKAVPVVRVNGDFLGCAIDPATTEVRFRFRPPSVRWGLLVSCLGLSFLMAVAFLPTTANDRVLRAEPGP